MARGPHVNPEFYGVYLLQLEPKPRSFYIGSLPDPVRRVRQHNGDLKVGGAFRTKRPGFRPWKMVLIVYNFPSKVAALQFEHAFQHPYQSRHIPPLDRISTKCSALNLHHRLGNVRLLLNSSFFRHLDLKVLLFDETVDKSWHQNKFNLLPNRVVDVELVKFDEFFLKQSENHLSEVFLAAKKRLLANPQCGICCKLVDFIPDALAELTTQSVVIDAVPLVTACEFCNTPFHLLCLGKHFLNYDGRAPRAIVPILASCPECSMGLQWSFQSKLATKLRAYILEDFFNVKASQSQPQEYDSTNDEEGNVM